MAYMKRMKSLGGGSRKSSDRSSRPKGDGVRRTKGRGIKTAAKLPYVRKNK